MGALKGLVLGVLLAQARRPSTSDTWRSSVSSDSPARQLTRSSDRADDDDVDCDCDDFCKWSCDMDRTAQQNVTMYRVTPGNITDLPNRDSGDAAGDLFFRLGDETYLPALCKVMPSYGKCAGGTGKWLLNDDVVIQFLVEVSGRYGPYAECNPIDATHNFQCAPIDCSDCPRSAVSVGLWNLSDISWGPPAIPAPFNMWKYSMNRLLGGLWYSTPTAGECRPGHRPVASTQAGVGTSTNCTWRVVRSVKAVNASCLDARVYAAIAARNSTCFRGCGPNAGPTTGNMCWLGCLYNTLLGSTDGSLGPTAMTKADVIAPWLKAFETDDPAAGGCPAVLQHVLLPAAAGAVVRPDSGPTVAQRGGR